MGAGLSYRTILLNTDFDILDASIDTLPGKKVQVRTKEASSYLATVIIYCRPGIHNSTEGIDALLSEKLILEFHQYKTRGMQIGEDMSTKSRVGAFIVQAESVNSLDFKISKALDRITVLNPKGKNIFRRDVYGKISQHLLKQN